jgi:hypothetical protein
MMYSLSGKVKPKILRTQTGPLPVFPHGNSSRQQGPAKSLLTRWFSCVILRKKGISYQQSAKKIEKERKRIFANS